MIRKFPSLGHPKEFGYAYDSEAWNNRGQGTPLHVHFRMYQTYGDGLCQHSGDWAVTTEHVADYLVSLTTALLADEELAEKVYYTILQRPRTDLIEFAASIVYSDKADKTGRQVRRYYSLEEVKISSSPSKQHDKRYQEIESRHDGSAESIFRILLPEYADGLMRLTYAEAIREWALAHNLYIPLVGEFLGWFPGDNHRNKSQALRQAFSACQNACEAYQRRAAAVCELGCYQNNHLRHLQEAAPEPESVVA